ncbi:MAG: hypothetical protein K0S44_997 [Bacteroidetes bacterium]|nr:hypothetical protein [Bacteroidota bacterium]
MPISPPTIGVATFDGVNAGGYPYNFFASSSSSGKADTLTSKPIDLNFPTDTSVYFSFFYQAQGRGNFPDPADSIILEFKAPLTGAWHHVWAKRGVNSSSTDSIWKLVMIHITNPAFLKSGFQFRFTNWATLSGNGDQWNIDYVYLDKGRNFADTVFKDVTFVYDTPSLLNTYTAVPWRQYSTSLMKSRYSATIRNNNTAPSYGGFGYQISENNLPVGPVYSGGAINYEPFDIIGYDTTISSSKPPVNYVIPALTEKTEYSIKSWLYSSPDNDFSNNDTVVHKQRFDNYFSYDDGSAEASYGLSGALHAQIAEKFTLNVADTLQCVDIYFNPTWLNASTFTFTLKVWGSTGGSPGPVIYLNPTLDTPKYNQSGHDRFTRYCFDAPVYLSAGTTFFVGLDQNTNQPLNIGLDKNINTRTYSYQNTNGSWMNMSTTGTLMIRPVLGAGSEVIGIAEPSLSKDGLFTVYPNPANYQLYLRSDQSLQTRLSYSIMDISGRTILSNITGVSEPIDISELSSGVYFIRIASGSSVSVNKFIISR